MSDRDADEIKSELDHILEGIKSQLFPLLFAEKYEIVGTRFGHDDSGKCHEDCRFCRSGKEKWGLFIELQKRTA